LKTIKKDRLILFLNPDKDPGGGYHLIQSRIAIGAGELWGQGLNQGTQTQLHPVPEQHTDFIFSAMKNWVLLCSCVVWLLQFASAWLIVQNAKDNFGSLLAIGVLSMLVFQVIVNIA